MNSVAHPKGASFVNSLLNAWSCAVWLNPLPEAHWHYTPSIRRLRELFGERMFPLTLDGLDRAMRALTR